MDGMNYEIRDATAGDKIIAQIMVTYEWSDCAMGHCGGSRASTCILSIGAQKTFEALGMVNPNYQVMEEIFGGTKC